MGWGWDGWVGWYRALLGGGRQMKADGVMHMGLVAVHTSVHTVQYRWKIAGCESVGSIYLEIYII